VNDELSLRLAPQNGTGVPDLPKLLGCTPMQVNDLGQAHLTQAERNAIKRELVGFAEDYRRGVMRYVRSR
jgi:hypothetical protein